MKILFIDHDDSFSNNIISYFQSKKIKVDIMAYKNLFKKNLVLSKYRAIVLSPGPGSPDDYPNTIKFYLSIKNNCVILGICLGMQIMLRAYGGAIRQIYDKPIHGKQLKFNCKLKSHFFKNENLKGTLVLYHSLGFFVSDPVFNNWDTLLQNNEICLIAEHKNYPHIGFQFHPESFASTGGSVLLDLIIRRLNN